MTIHQLKECCWEFQPPTDDERCPHFGTEADALQTLKEDRENDEQPYAETKPVQLASPCWLVQCDGECEVVLDTEDEGYTFHHDSRADAEATMAAYRYAFGDDGRVFCEEDAPADAVVLPSPELEAAGQLVLPRRAAVTAAQRAAALADPVVNCKRAGISLEHITATLSRVELAALVDVLAAQVAGPPPRYRDVLRAAHAERTRLMRAGLPVPYRVLVLDSEYRARLRQEKTAATSEGQERAA